MGVFVPSINLNNSEEKSKLESRGRCIKVKSTKKSKVLCSFITGVQIK